MSKKQVIKPTVAAVGAAFVGTLAGQAVADTTANPFAMNALSDGYMVADTKDMEGRCGEGKCGGSMAAPAKPAEGQCGGAKAPTEGQCGGAKPAKPAEGQCGGAKPAKPAEGQCGGAR